MEDYTIIHTRPLVAPMSWGISTGKRRKREEGRRSPAVNGHWSIRPSIIAPAVREGKEKKKDPGAKSLAARPHVCFCAGGRPAPKSR